MATPIYQARNWVYAVTSVDVQPQIDESIRNAHQYRNKLCELELAKRARHEELLQQLAPEYVHITLMIAAKERELEQSREGIQAARIEQRTKKPTGIDHLTTAIRDCKACLKTLRDNCRDIKKAAYDDPNVKAAMAQNLSQHKAACKEAKKESGLYWATEAIVKQSSASFGSGAPPRFKRYDGTGQIAIQFQGGLDTDSMTDECNTLCYFGDFLTYTDKHGRKRTSNRRECYFRIGSADKGKPIFGKLTVIFCRDLPQGNVKWGYLERRKIADMPRWSLRLTIESEIDTNRPCLPESVAVHFGWRKQPSGGLRVATWIGTDGDTGSVVLTEKHCQDYFRLDQIATDRAGQLKTMREFIKSLPSEHLPDWLKEEQSTCHTWKSPARYQTLLRKWRDNRFDFDVMFIMTPQDPVGFSRFSRYENGWTKKSHYYGPKRVSNHHAILTDETTAFDVLGITDDNRFSGDHSLRIFDAFERLVLRDKSLWQHSCRLSKRISKRRADQYRKFVVMLTRKYGVAYVGDIAIADLNENSQPEQLEHDNTIAHRHARWASVGELQRYIGEKFILRTIPIDSKNVTKECSKCGHINNPRGRALQCRECNASFDVDVNAVINTLKRGHLLHSSGFLDRLLADAVAAQDSKKDRLAKMQEANRNKKRAAASA